MGLRKGGGNFLKYLKRGWNRKEGSGNKDFQRKGGQVGSRGGCLKKRLILMTWDATYDMLLMCICFSLCMFSGTNLLNIH